MPKRKIKTRKQRLIDYNEDIIKIPLDPIERIMYCIGDKLSIKRVKNIIERKEKILRELTYSCIRFTLYEYPMGSERPRSRRIGNFISNYVPNAKANKEYVKSIIGNLNDDIKIICTPIYINLRSYHKMPNNMPVEEQVLFEAGILHPITEPDFDNIAKSYTDQMIETIILNDDLIYKAKIEKFFSFLPRVELDIYYENEFVSKYIYNRIKNRKSFIKLKEHINITLL